MEARGGAREQRRRPIGLDDRDPRRRGQRRRADDGDRAARARVGDEACAVGARPREREEDVAGSDLARVGGDAGDLDVAVAAQVGANVVDLCEELTERHERRIPGDRSHRLSPVAASRSFNIFPGAAAAPGAGICSMT